MWECIQYSISFQQTGIVFTCYGPEGLVGVEFLSGIKILCTKKFIYLFLSYDQYTAVKHFTQSAYMEPGSKPA